MRQRLQTIYEYLSDYSEKEIDDLIHSLGNEDKLLINDRYGNDLHNPQPTGKWNSEKSKQFYGILIPKIKRSLRKGKNESVNATEVEPVNERTIEIENLTSSLIEMISLGKNNREICENLHINSQQLYAELLNLKNRGFTYSRKYYSDGSIKYDTISRMQVLKDYQTIGRERTIITDPNENMMKILVISDLHFGNELERLDLTDRAYNYCIKNGINLIFCGGDLIEGAYSSGERKITDLYQQIEYFINNYPQDKSIITFAVAGNHDISAFNAASFDIIEVCNNFRHDVIIGGYNNAEIQIKNDKIQLYHHINAGTMLQLNAPIILHGHAHKFLTNIENDVLHVNIPTLSGINQLMPSALELNLKFNKGYIADSEIKHLYFGPQNQDIVLGEIHVDLLDVLTKRKVNYEPIKNTESFRKNTISTQDMSSTQDTTEPKVLQKTNPMLSQIEKFNRRYGKASEKK